ncbi:Acid phosphatase protein [Dioscorea alata]|uniref:Acid phosphatase protein n=1 Tax=Dioscorea alata TaxID=55571 RepID=A0ACB7URY7_DIOAL|nr:Acid phosphatase protein [Dioscorea alata]
MSVRIATAQTIPNLRFCHSIHSRSLPTNPTLLVFKPPSHSRRLRAIPFTIVSSSSPSSMSSSSAQSMVERKPFSVLFVCLGNICRSPAAEAVFRDIVRKRGLEPKFVIDSAGTINYHEGNQADPRMRSAAKRRGIEVTSISRPIRPSDFSDFDLIVAMDVQNKEDILGAYERWRFKEPLPEDGPKKVKLMCSYCKKHKETEVPDPYYGGPQGFENVLDLLEDACESLLDSIVAENSHVCAS